MRFLEVFLACCICVGSLSMQSTRAAESFSDEKLEFFEKEVRPLLVEHCYSCHSAKAKKLQASLRLDSRDHILRGGDSGSAAVSGKPDESLLIEAVRYESFEMPPRGKLSSDDVKTLTKWVQLGLPWPDEKAETLANADDFDFEARLKSHWSWEPVVNPALPSVVNQDWPINPIDYFVLARLEDRDLPPAKQADKRALIRRLYFDLIGLPPSRDAIHEFLADDSRDAYEQVVDQLLQSKHFGEKWARHWMDLVRYGDTLGHEFDYPLRHAFQYRDYLIRAFNADVPYDQFVTEHIAGDLMDPPRLHATDKYNESIIGTGFWLLGETVHAPTDVRADEAGRIDNQIDVMCKTFLGLTVGCARCHDHKFDAIPTTDYYALTGFLQSSRRQEALLDPHGNIQSLSQQLDRLNVRANRQLHRAYHSGSDTEFADFLVSTSSPKDHENLDQSQRERWVSAVKSKAIQKPAHPLYAWFKLVSEEKDDGDGFVKRRDGLASELQKLQAEYKEKLSTTELYKDFSDGSLDGWYLTGDAFGDAPTRAQWDTLSGSGMLVKPGTAHSGLRSKRLRGVLRSPTFVFNHKQIHYRIKSTDIQIRLIVDGYAMDIFNALLFQDVTLENVKTKGETRWVTQHRDLYHYVGHRAHIEIIDHSDGFAALEEIRFSNGTSLPEPPSTISLQLASDPSIKSPADLAKQYQAIWRKAVRNLDEADESAIELVNWIQKHDLVDLETARLATIQTEREALEEKIPVPIHVQAMADGDGEDDFVHIRGNHKNLGPVVPRRLLLGIDQNQPTIQAGSGRLELAKRMVSPRNPFVSRVMVNRLWHHLFGRGIVASVDDFGRMGQMPTHPELLDWLANDFVKNGWSIKQILKRMVMSQSYRMSSQTEVGPDVIASKDAANDFLHKARIRRIAAESIRDSVLSVSGRFNDQMFGPNVPIHLTSFMEGRGRPGKSGPLDGNGRRSVYLEVRRNFLSPMMLAFDMPSPFNTMGRRSNSNVPAQSLMLMNNPFVLQEAKRWAKKLAASKVPIDEKIELAFESAIGRPPSERQREQLVWFVDEQSREYDSDETDIRVWTDVCHIIMNMKEFIYLN